jgi:hypothetical protein
MSNESPATELPDEDVRVLQGLNVKIRYIPKSAHESFYATVMQKFRILSLTEYRRVILMDGDVMPLTNLDYIFEMSDGENATLKENLVIAGPWEPANAGFFMLTPGEGEFERVTEIIRTRQENALNATGGKFDVVNGWGHVIQPPDQWVSRKERGTNWTFHFAFSDQGLCTCLCFRPPCGRLHQTNVVYSPHCRHAVFHWTKYVKKSVSIVYMYDVENWSSYPNGTVRLEERMVKPFGTMSSSNLMIYAHAACVKFMCSFKHFTGKDKPWLGAPPADLLGETEYKDTHHVWWTTLKDIDTYFGMGLDFDNIKNMGRPGLGLFTTHNDMNKHVAIQ